MVSFSEIYKLRHDISTQMDKIQDEKNGILEVILILSERSRMNSQTINLIISKQNDLKYEKFIAKIIKDFIHMSLNRLFLDRQRKYELVVYTFLERYYSSMAKIAKNNSIQKINTII